MSALYDKFLEYMLLGGKIIDIGCGSGRNIKYFLGKRYKMTGIDGSKEMCQIFRNQGLDVEEVTIQEWVLKDCYDGIWANASFVYLQPVYQSAKNCGFKSWIYQEENLQREPL